MERPLARSLCNMRNININNNDLAFDGEETEQMDRYVVRADFCRKVDE